MKIKANLLNKPVNFQMDDCQIEKVVELPRDQFSALVITPLTNQPFIAENKRWMFADDSAVHCLLVLGQGSGDGVLIYSAGYDYPFSKRTGVYAVASYMNDDESKGTNAAADWNPSAYTVMVGLRHKF